MGTGSEERKGRKCSVRRLEDFALPKQERDPPKSQLPPHHAATLIIGAAGRQKSPSCNLDSFSVPGTLSRFNSPKIATKKLLLTYFRVGETNVGGNDMT